MLKTFKDFAVLEVHSISIGVAFGELKKVTLLIFANPENPIPFMLFVMRFAV